MIVVGILAAIAVPAVLQRRKAYETSAKSDVKAITREMLAQYVDGRRRLTRSAAAPAPGDPLRSDGGRHRPLSKHNVVSANSFATAGGDFCLSVRNTEVDAQFWTADDVGLRAGDCPPTELRRRPQAATGAADDHGHDADGSDVHPRRRHEPGRGHGRHGLFVVASLSLLCVLAPARSGTFDNRARVTAARSPPRTSTRRGPRAPPTTTPRHGDIYEGSSTAAATRVVRTVATTCRPAPTPARASASPAAPASCTSGSPRRSSPPTAARRPRAGRHPGQGAGLRPQQRTRRDRPRRHRPRRRPARRASPPSRAGLTRTTDAKGCAFFDGAAGRDAHAR